MTSADATAQVQRLRPTFSGSQVRGGTTAIGWVWGKSLTTDICDWSQMINTNNTDFSGKQKSTQQLDRKIPCNDETTRKAVISKYNTIKENYSLFTFTPSLSSSFRLMVQFLWHFLIWHFVISSNVMCISCLAVDQLSTSTHDCLRKQSPGTAWTERAWHAAVSTAPSFSCAFLFTLTDGWDFISPLALTSTHLHSTKE